MNPGVTDGRITLHIRVRNKESTKQHSNESEKLRRCQKMKVRNNESTKQQMYKTVKQRKSDIAKLRKGGSARLQNNGRTMRNKENHEIAKQRDAKQRKGLAKLEKAGRICKRAMRNNEWAEVQTTNQRKSDAKTTIGRCETMRLQNNETAKQRKGDAKLRALEIAIQNSQWR